MSTGVSHRSRCHNERVCKKNIWKIKLSTEHSRMKLATNSAGGIDSCSRRRPNNTAAAARTTPSESVQTNITILYQTSVRPNPSKQTAKAFTKQAFVRIRLNKQHHPLTNNRSSESVQTNSTSLYQTSVRPNPFKQTAQAITKQAFVQIRSNKQHTPLPNKSSSEYVQNYWTA